LPRTLSIVNVDADNMKITVIEKITLYGTSKISTPEDFPLVQAGKWAISHSVSKIVKSKLEHYIKAHYDSVHETIVNGVEIILTLKHEMLISAEAGSFVITRDSYTDRSVDTPTGKDTVDWTDTGFNRVYTDFTETPDFQLFHTPVEVIGQALLDEYLSVYGEANITDQPDDILAAYNHTTGKNYAVTYTSNPSKYCPGYTILQDTAKYNPNYQTQGCFDCSNYISQALKQGGIPTDGTWKPYIYLRLD